MLPDLTATMAVALWECGDRIYYWTVQRAEVWVVLRDGGAWIPGWHTDLARSRTAFYCHSKDYQRNSESQP